MDNPAITRGEEQANFDFQTPSPTEHYTLPLYQASNMTRKPRTPREFISDLTVVYGDSLSEAPSGRVRELIGRSDDINAGFGGKYVWLVPQYTMDTTTAASSFEVVVQPQFNSNKDDLAKGAGGDYRYLIPDVNPRNDNKIYRVALLRSEDSIEIIPVYYNGKTGDINRGRRGNYLYLIWETLAERDY